MRKLKPTLQPLPLPTYGDCIETEAPAGEARAYILVDRNHDDLPQWIEELRSQTTHWHIMLSEPLPPYHFA